MYIQYKTLANWSGQDLVSDITALFTGTTDVNTLSASCDKVNTSLLTNSVSAGWTLLDNVGDASYSRVLTAPDYTGSTTKYLKIRYNAGNPLVFNLYTTWNTVTHTGTDVTPDTYLSTGVTTTVSLLLYILITPEYFVILGYQSGGWLTRPVYLLEMNRNSPFTNYYNSQYLKANHILFGYISSQFDSVRCGVCTKTKNLTATGDVPGIELSISGLKVAYTSGGSGYAPSPLYPGQNNNGNNPGISVMEPYIVIYNTSYGGCAILGTLKSAVITLASTEPNFSYLDEVVIGTVTYLVIVPGNIWGTTVLVPKV